MRDKKEKLQEALNEIGEMYGRDVVVRLGDAPMESIKSISSGSVLIDYALGVGGFPKGRITEIFGQESSGKTTLALMAIAEAQKSDGVACLIDAEHAFDPIYAEKIGVNVMDLLVVKPENGEVALEIVEKLIRSGGVDIIVVDSVAAITPKAEVEGVIGDDYIELQASILSQAIRKMIPSIYKEQVALVFINQLREVKNLNLYGPNEVTLGGRALKFFASIRLEVKTTGKIMVNSTLVGNVITIRVVKNKMATPFKQIQLEMQKGKGISREIELFQLANDFGIIKKMGAWYTYKDEKLGQGKEDTLRIMQGQIFDEIKEQVKSMMKISEEAEGGLEIYDPLTNQTIAPKLIGSAGM